MGERAVAPRAAPVSTRRDSLIEADAQQMASPDPAVRDRASRQRVQWEGRHISIGTGAAVSNPRWGGDEYRHLFATLVMSRGACITACESAAVLFGDDLRTQLDALVADRDRRRRAAHDRVDIAATLAAERAAQRVRIGSRGGGMLRTVELVISHRVVSLSQGHIPEVVDGDTQRGRRT